MNYPYWWRMLNVLLAALVLGICFVKAHWNYMNRARDARVLGLGVLAIAIAWMSIVRRYESFKPWLPFLTIGLALCFYGMRRRASGEKKR